MEISTSLLSGTFVKDLYARMLLTRIVDDAVQRLDQQGRHGLAASCRGHEAAQVGSAVCIEVGKDFTLPFYRDLGVVLTIGMTPYEVFRTYMQLDAKRSSEDQNRVDDKQGGIKTMQPALHWGYHKHNLVTGSAPVATQVLHAAGIAFACKLRKAAVVTVAYCGDGATAEPDFLEGITFAAQHQLPVVIVYEQDEAAPSLNSLPLPVELERWRIDGTDVVAVYTGMRAAMQHAREGQGPVLLEMRVQRFGRGGLAADEGWLADPLLCFQRYMEERGVWDEEWVTQLYTRLYAEVEQAVQDAARDISARADALTMLLSTAENVLD